MNNREFFNTLVVNGKLDNLNKSYVRSLYDSEVYVGNLGRLLVNKNMLKFVQVMTICAKVTQLYGDDKKSREILNKIEYLLRDYLKFTSFTRVSEFISNMLIFLNYKLQLNDNKLDDYLDYCKIVKYINDDKFYDSGKCYNLKQTYSSNKLRVFRINEEIITPLVVIHKGEFYYNKEDELESSEARVNKVAELLKDKNINLIFMPYVESEYNLLNSILDL